MTSPGPSNPSFEVPALARLLDGEQAAVRARVRRILSRPSFRYLPVTASIEEQRRQAFQWCRELAEEGVGMLSVPQRYGGEGDFAGFMAAFETIAFHDLGMTIKFTVQFGIWLGSVLLLGNERQHELLLKKIGTFALPGCFAMTEIGHGSNVRELETTATYDAEKGEFVVNSPTWTAGKNYIGNGACDGRLATVFAQLETGGERQGVHAFLVPLRDEAGKVLPGVRIEDNGPKMGENGVDNARIWFHDVRVGRGALLDRFGGVAADGSYRSTIRSAGARFFATISALVGGRISIALAGLSAAKSGLTIAVKYAARRRQFRAPGAAEDTPLLNYPTHQRRLLPLLANALALDFVLKELVRRRSETLESVEGRRQKAEGRRQEAVGPVDPAKQRELELLSAGVKAWGTWNTTRTLQTCRECCGGEGYMSVNRLPTLKADSDIFTTFEGDNTVLMLWVGRQLLAEHERVGGAPPEHPKAGLTRTVAEAVAGRGGPGREAAPGWTEEFLRAQKAGWDKSAGDAGKPESFRALFRQRETGMLEEIRQALQGLAEGGVQGHEAVATQQGALLQAAHAYVERVMLEQFTAVVDAQEAGSGVGRTLRKLGELFAMTLVEQHRGWYLERRLIPAGMSMALGTRVDRLCAELAPEAEGLVEAFGIPAQCLAAPIAGV